MGGGLELKLARKSYRDVIDDTPTIALLREFHFADIDQFQWQQCSLVFVQCGFLFRVDYTLSLSKCSH